MRWPVMSPTVVAIVQSALSFVLGACRTSGVRVIISAFTFPHVMRRALPAKRCRIPLGRDGKSVL